MYTVQDVKRLQDLVAAKNELVEQERELRRSDATGAARAKATKQANAIAKTVDDLNHEIRALNAFTPLPMSPERVRTLLLSDHEYTVSLFDQEMAAFLERFQHAPTYALEWADSFTTLAYEAEYSLRVVGMGEKHDCTVTGTRELIKAIVKYRQMVADKQMQYTPCASTGNFYRATDSCKAVARTRFLRREINEDRLNDALDAWELLLRENE